MRGPAYHELLIECSDWKHLKNGQREAWARHAADTHPGFTDEHKTGHFGLTERVIQERVIERHVPVDNPALTSELVECLQNLRGASNRLDGKIDVFHIPEPMVVETQVIVEKFVERERIVEKPVRDPELHQRLKSYEAVLVDVLTAAQRFADREPVIHEVEKQVVVTQPQPVDVYHEIVGPEIERRMRLLSLKLDGIVGLIVILALWVFFHLK